MDTDTVCRELLKDLYAERIKKLPGQIYLDQWAKSKELDPNEVWDIYSEYLKSDYLADEFSTAEIQLTAKGILEAEGRGIAPGQVAREEQAIRHKILLALNSLQAARGDDAPIDWTDVVQEAGIRETEFQRNYAVLEYEGWIRKVPQRCFEMTRRGKDYLKARKE